MNVFNIRISNSDMLLAKNNCSELLCCILFSGSYLSSPKPGHVTCRSGRLARQGGRAGMGRTGYKRNCLSRKQKSPVTSKASKISKILYKPNAGTKPAFESRSIYGQFICGTSTSRGRKALFLPYQVFLMRGMFGNTPIPIYKISRIRNPVTLKTNPVLRCAAGQNGGAVAAG